MTDYTNPNSFPGITFCISVFFLFLISKSAASFAQSSDLKLKSDGAKLTPSFKQKDTSYWVVNFREFRNALYQNDRKKVKEFFNFPFLSESNDIWYLVGFYNEKSIDTLGEKPKPFAEKDFDKYFSKIFSMPFINCFLKIKTDELYKKGTHESPELKHDSTLYKLYADFDRNNRTIELNLATRTPYKVSETEYENAESNIIYRFKILSNGHLKLTGVFLAG